MKDFRKIPFHSIATVRDTVVTPVSSPDLKGKPESHWKPKTPC